MQKIGIMLIAVLFGVLCMGVASIAEEITLTTYYPAPYGAYDQLVTDSLGVGDNNGSGAIDGGDTPTTSGHVWVAGNVGIGTTAPAYQLDVSGEARFDGALYALDATGIGLRDDAGNLGLWVEDGGEVGIGMTAPTATLHVNGNIKAVLSNVPGSAMEYNPGTNEIGFDIAELFSASEEVERGDLLVIDETEDLSLRKSRSIYEKGIVGVASGSPAILFEGSQLEIAPTPGEFKKGRRPPVALAGRIKCKVSIENGPIDRGDLLTSSSTPGHAMKATDRDRSFGAIVGKALESFDGGPNGEETGKITILVTLQ